MGQSGMPGCSSPGFSFSSTASRIFFKFACTGYFLSPDSFVGWAAPTNTSALLRVRRAETAPIVQDADDNMLSDAVGVRRKSAD